MLQPLYRDLSSIKDLDVKRDVDLSRCTTFRIGGKAGLFVIPRSIQALEGAVRSFCHAGIPLRILGNGSNLLISDAGVPAVINLSGLYKLEVHGDHLVVYAGLPISRLLRWCLENGYAGMECLAGIPASLGGALFMNAGAGGCETGDFVQEILVTGASGSSWLDVSALDCHYRSIHIEPGTIISALKIPLNHEGVSGDSAEKKALYPCNAQKVLHKIRHVMHRRINTQPLGEPSAGCVFRNPEGRSAWSLIAACGLQGFCNGRAQVSRKHANFIVNKGGAGFCEVRDLISIVKEKVLEQTGILLKEEVVIWENAVLH